MIYQVCVRSFADSDGDGIGDLPGVRSRRPYLRDLGVDALWLNPFYPSPPADAGYDVAEHRDVDPARIRADPTAIQRTIVADGVVAGNIVSWLLDGQRLLGYWVGREQWGRGVATQALLRFADEVSTRPLYAHVAVHNVGSIRVLEKCGFVRDRGQEAEAPGPDDGIEEFIFVLDA